MWPTHDFLVHLFNYKKFIPLLISYLIKYNFAKSRLSQNFKSIGPIMLPTEQHKVANFVSTISQERL
ncbi:hypothetical protein O3M35_009235 [Rhynocoris fuscipes]|uniref:Uncharacterized protein n=1 Tax=Rhynocoris fuscipes TaxID=488301 RepID=A0AAW1D551_9HEMI